MQVHLHEAPGDILMFLTGQGEITKVVFFTHHHACPTACLAAIICVRLLLSIAIICASTAGKRQNAHAKKQVLLTTPGS